MFSTKSVGPPFRLAPVTIFCGIILAASFQSILAQDSLRKAVYGEPPTAESKKPAAERKTTAKPPAPKKAAPVKRSAAVNTRKAAPGKASVTTSATAKRSGKRPGMVAIFFESKMPGTQVFLNGNLIGTTNSERTMKWIMTPGTYRVTGKLKGDVVYPEKLMFLNGDSPKVRLYEEPVPVVMTEQKAREALAIKPTQAELEMAAAREMSAKVLQIFSDYLDPLKSDRVSIGEWQFASDAAVLGGFQNLSTQQIEAQRAFAAGQVAMANKDPKKAFDSFSLAIRSFPTSPLPYVGLGDAYAFSQQMDDARKSYEQAKLRGKHLAIIHRRLGDTYRLLKQRKEAIEAYSEAIRLGDTRYETKFFRARATIEADKPLAAIPMLEELLPENPRAEVYFSLGEAYEMLKRDVAALDNFRKAVDIDPKSAIAQYRLALVYYEQREYEKAVKGFDAAIELDGEQNTFSRKDAALKRSSALMRIKDSK